MNRANQEVRGHNPGHTRGRRQSHSAVLGFTNAKSLCFLGVSVIQGANQSLDVNGRLNNDLK